MGKISFESNGLSAVLTLGKKIKFYIKKTLQKNDAVFDQSRISTYKRMDLIVPEI